MPLNLLPTCAELRHDGFNSVAVDGFQALGGHVQRDRASFRGQVERTTLDIRVPTTVRAAVRVRDGLTEARFPSRDLAICRHGLLLPPTMGSAKHQPFSFDGGNTFSSTLKMQVKALRCLASGR